MTYMDTRRCSSAAGRLRLGCLIRSSGGLTTQCIMIDGSSHFRGDHIYDHGTTIESAEAITREGFSISWTDVDGDRRISHGNSAYRDGSG